jgi:hypothetical protein
MMFVRFLFGFIFKGFFRRCITQGMNHQCTNNQQCEMTPFSRNSCQFCRLKKCFAVGMSREASRLGRRPKRAKDDKDERPIQANTSGCVTPSSTPSKLTNMSSQSAHSSQGKLINDELNSKYTNAESLLKVSTAAVISASPDMSLSENDSHSRQFENKEEKAKEKFAKVKKEKLAQHPQQLQQQQQIQRSNSPLDISLSIPQPPFKLDNSPEKFPLGRDSTLLSSLSYSSNYSILANSNSINNIPKGNNLVTNINMASTSNQIINGELNKSDDKLAVTGASPMLTNQPNLTTTGVNNNNPIVEMVTSSSPSFSSVKSSYVAMSAMNNSIMSNLKSHSSAAQQQKELCQQQMQTIEMLTKLISISDRHTSIERTNELEFIRTSIIEAHCQIWPTTFDKIRRRYLERPPIRAPYSPVRRTL